MSKLDNRRQRGISMLTANKTPEQQLAEAYRVCFTSAAGQGVLRDLRRRFGRRRSFVDGRERPLTTAFREGQRDVYLLIMDFMEKQIGSAEEAES